MNLYESHASICCHASVSCVLIHMISQLICISIRAYDMGPVAGVVLPLSSIRLSTGMSKA